MASGKVDPVDRTDRMIIQLLQEDGRRSNVDIARKLDISEGTVRKRLDRLLASEAISIAGVSHPSRLGYVTRVLILLTVEINHIEDVAAELARSSEVMAVYTIMGEYDVMVEAVFESNAELTAFLREKLACLPGIVGSKTSHIAMVLKERQSWCMPAPAPPKVLIVDDDPDFIEITRTILVQAGFDVCSASSGDAAVRVLDSESPDLVVLDIMMDGVLDGWDASWRIRSNNAFRDIPILVVSSITASDYLSVFPTDEDNLIDNFMSKPVDPRRLVREINRLLNRK